MKCNKFFSWVFMLCRTELNNAAIKQLQDDDVDDDYFLTKHDAFSIYYDVAKWSNYFFLS